MISIYTGKNIQIENKIIKYFSENNLENFKKSGKQKKIKDILKINYSNSKYKEEANLAQPNNTLSRKEIFRDNDLIFDGKKNYIKKPIATVTTKQDRHPNSGVIVYPAQQEGKANFRYLTPRECFILMGFEEKDYQQLINNNFEKKKNVKFFTYEKLYKLSGNSIVVNVLEGIFKQIDEIDKKILFKKQLSQIFYDEYENIKNQKLQESRLAYI
jgi:DNA (cytosine-5)-methyltransferase 1